MKMKMRPRYYCDHCGKGNGSPSAMRRHEPSCTMNPRRMCRMCGTHRNMEMLAGILSGCVVVQGRESWKAKMEILREACEDCPCCILAAIRQSGVQKDRCQFDGEDYPDNSDMIWRNQGWATGDVWLGFDFKMEKEVYLKNRAHDERYY